MISTALLPIRKPVAQILVTVRGSPAGRTEPGVWIISYMNPRPSEKTDKVFIGKRKSQIKSAADH
jgi:hypothetical protein